jgi:hypothetical protein
MPTRVCLNAGALTKTQFAPAEREKTEQIHKAFEAMRSPVPCELDLVRLGKEIVHHVEMTEVVSLALSEKHSRIGIRVHNPGFIPEESRLRIFQRSFSTKGRGRGLPSRASSRGTPPRVCGPRGAESR